MDKTIDMYKRVLDNLYDGVYFVDTNRKILFWNKSAEKITGFLSEEVINRSCSDNILKHIDKYGECLCTGICPLLLTLKDGMQRETTVYLHHKEGHRIPVYVRTTTMNDENGKITGGIEIFSVVRSESDLLEKISELQKLAMSDNLTSLPNRKFTKSALELKLYDFEKNTTPFGILFFDIDNFKSINDTYGHEVGDKVLKMVAQSLTSSLRSVDIIGRWGGEEFLGIFPVDEIFKLLLISERLRFLVENSFFLIEEKKISVTVSIGGSIVSKNDSLESIVGRADLLMYKSKKEGKNRSNIV